MGQISSVLSAISTANSAASNASRFSRLVAGESDTLKNLRLQQAQAAEQLRARQGLEEELAARKKSPETAILQAESAAAERRRVQALAAASAKQRAVSGAAGVGSADGSGEAVLLGLFTQSDAERIDAEKLAEIRRQILDENFESLRARNLLEFTQLSAEQSLRRRLI